MKVIEQSHEILTPIEIINTTYKFIEQYGRVAYKSEDKITIGSTEKFIANIIKRGHESVLEHFNITVKFITDRGVTHELVRHRIASFTQESTRYCNYAGKDMVFIKPVFWNKDNVSYMLWQEVMEHSEVYYNIFMNKSYNASPQEARTVLPNSLKTEIVMTTNIREWRHVLKLRTDKTAHPQMRALMIPLLKEFQTLMSILFNDIIIKEE